MCGIIVSIGKQNITNFLNKIVHRGSDSSYIYTDERITIGFNRLAINDKTEQGNQPFEYKNLVGVFNGEIYNSSELKNQFNIKLVSHSDIEIILPLFEILGKDIINHLDGFYSGIIYNKTTKELFTLRDYIGKKPLFLVTNKNTNFIVSELKSMDYIDIFKNPLCI